MGEADLAGAHHDLRSIVVPGELGAAPGSRVGARRPSTGPLIIRSRYRRPIEQRRRNRGRGNQSVHVILLPVDSPSSQMRNVICSLTVTTRKCPAFTS